MTDDHEEEALREQVETALLLLEHAHGLALERPWSDEAHAYYEAIDTVEDALDENWRTDHDRLEEEMAEEIQRSREAREKGYEAATLSGDWGESDSSADGGLWSRIRGIVNAE